MNNFVSLTRFACIPALLFLAGCLEEHVHTSIFSDGSSERTITMKLPSREIPAKAFPVPGDSGWTVEWREISEKDVKYEFVAKKNFPDAEALQREYAGMADSGIVGLRVELAKRFEWFFSYLEYNETYTFRNPLGNVPVSAYLSQDEIARFVRGEKSDSLKEKVKLWTSRDMFEELYRPLVAEARRLNNPALPAPLMEDKKDEFFLLVMKVDSANSKKNRADTGGVRTLNDNIDSAQSFLRLFAKFLHTDAVYTLRPAAEHAWAMLEAKLAEMKHPDGWVSSVQMPGIILETNSTDVEGNTVTWKFDPDQIQVGDFAMHAVSRTTNVWAFIATGLIVLLSLLFVVLPRRH
jgi:hypothetical protein